MSNYMSLRDLAKYLAVSVGTVRKWMASGDIPPETYYMIGATRRFDVDAVEAALRSATHDARQLELPLEDKNNTPKET